MVKEPQNFDDEFEEVDEELTPEQLAYLQQMYYKDMGMFERRVAKIKHGWAIRKTIMDRERAYFSSEESDPERLAAQEVRNKEFIGQLKGIGVVALIFLILYFLLRLIIFW